MSGQVPSDEQLARIERGVHRRIDARRRAIRGVTGGAAGLAIVVGGFALVLPALGGAGSGSSAGSGGGTIQRYAASDAAAIPVICHGTTRRSVQAEEAGLPASAAEACVAATLRGAAGSPESATDAGDSGSSTAADPSAVCRAEDGAVHVYVGSFDACAAHGMETVTEP
jgi:hypothetical protein